MARMTSERLDFLAKDKSISLAERTEMVEEIRASWADVLALKSITILLDTRNLAVEIDRLVAEVARLRELGSGPAPVPVPPVIQVQPAFVSLVVGQQGELRFLVNNVETEARWTANGGEFAPDNKTWFGTPGNYSIRAESRVNPLHVAIATVSIGNGP